MTTAIGRVAAQEQEEHLAAIRSQLAERGVDAFCVPRADEYLGEYIPEQNERLRWLTGFTGSAGIAVVTAKHAGIFVDGRYTVQVRRQVDGSLYQYRHLIEEPPVAWLCDELPAGAKVLIDPRMCSLRWYQEAKSQLEATGLEVVLDTDNPIDRCWTDRPQGLAAPALLLEETFTGESSRSKRERIGAAISEAGADAALIFAPDSVSWLLNIRGRDVPMLPVLLSFAVLHADGNVDVIVDPKRVPDGLHDHTGPGVNLIADTQAEAALRAHAGKRVLADVDTANAWTQLTLEDAGATLIAGADPILLPKACKNAVEIAGAREAHRRDAVAEIRFLAWLDSEVAEGRYHDEAVVSDKLGEFRADGALFHEPSFDTISASASNGAMCHYNHRDNTPALLEPNSLYLVDSGGQYSDGTTDITRTVAIGQVTADMRKLFTRVLQGHIALDQARFPHGTTGTHLDALARQFLWQDGLDFDHGTGHGVGAFLSVHEGPQRIAKAWNPTALARGMIVSNEPGYYRDGEFGIRCENLCVVVAVEDDAHEVPMLGFEALTLVPFDRRLIDVALLSDGELQWINDYHARVLTDVGVRIDDPSVKSWLEAAAAPIAR
ncbi:MAG: aminopeptidase P family protein [Pseudomonadota bacterium]